MDLLVWILLVDYSGVHLLVPKMTSKLRLSIINRTFLTTSLSMATSSILNPSFILDLITSSSYQVYGNNDTINRKLNIYNQSSQSIYNGTLTSGTILTNRQINMTLAPNKYVYVS